MMPDTPIVPDGSFGDVLYDNDSPDARPYAMIWHQPDITRGQICELIVMLNEYADTMRLQLDIPATDLPDPDRPLKPMWGIADHFEYRAMARVRDEYVRDQIGDTADA